LRTAAQKLWLIAAGLLVVALVGTTLAVGWILINAEWPWSIDEHEESFLIKNSSGQARDGHQVK
jgi:Tfp pilus assembly protein PilN